MIILGFILTFFFTEPYESKKRLTLSSSMKHMMEGLSYFWNHKYVKYLVFFSMSVITASDIMMSMSSAYFSEILIPVGLIGVVAFVASMIQAWSSKSAHRVEDLLGEKRSLLAVQVGAVASAFLLAIMLPVYGVLLYFLVHVVAGFFFVIINHYVNLHIETSHRATILSIKNLFNNLGVFMMFPVVGYIAKGVSLGRSFLIFGVVLLAYNIWVVWYGSRLKQIQ